jgi:hypothetical protein
MTENRSANDLTLKLIKSKLISDFRKCEENKHFEKFSDELALKVPIENKKCHFC